MMEYTKNPYYCIKSASHTFNSHIMFWLRNKKINDLIHTLKGLVEASIIIHFIEPYLTSMTLLMPLL